MLLKYLNLFLQNYFYRKVAKKTFKIIEKVAKKNPFRVRNSERVFYFREIIFAAAGILPMPIGLVFIFPKLKLFFQVSDSCFVLFDEFFGKGVYCIDRDNILKSKTSRLIEVVENVGVIR